MSGLSKPRLLLTALGAAALVLLPAATASHTPNPTSVTIAGSLQSEAGCAGDWDPACAATHLAYDAGDDVWQGTFTLPAGSYEYKAALNDSWDENYGLHAQLERREHPAEPRRRPASVKFYYDHKTPLGHRQQELGDRGRAGELPVRARLPGRLGSRAACARGSRIPTATASTRSRRRRCRPARTRRRSRSTRTGTRTTARAASRRGATSRSPSRPTTRRSPSATSPRRTC